MFIGPETMKSLRRSEERMKLDVYLQVEFRRSERRRGWVVSSVIDISPTG